MNNHNIFSLISAGVADNIVLSITPAQLREFALHIIDECKNAKQPREDKLLTAGEVCAMLRVNKVTLWRRTKEGALRCIRVGGKVFYSKQVVEDYLKENSAASAN